MESLGGRFGEALAVELLPAGRPNEIAELNVGRTSFAARITAGKSVMGTFFPAYFSSFLTELFRFAR